MTMNTAQAVTNPNVQKNSLSSGEEQETDELRSARLRVQAEEASVRHANTTAIVLLIAYAALSGAIALSSLWVNKANARLRNAEKLLSSLEVAKLKTETERVRTEAQRQIALLTADAERAREGIALAQAVAAKANEKAESERRVRAELEKSLSPRVILLVRDGDKANFDSLKPFAGTQVTIKHLPDAEPRRAAREIHELLAIWAGWEVVSSGLVTTEDLAVDGITVQPYFNAKTGEHDSSKNAAEALVTFLKLVNIEAHESRDNVLREIPELANVPPHSVKVVIGLKPDPYFETRRAEMWHGERERLRKKSSKS